MEKPVALDLGCGDGGWTEGLLAAGWRVIGVDIERRPKYRGEFIQCDVRLLDTSRLPRILLVCASMPCDEYARWSMPWTRAKNPPPPDTSLVNRCYEIARDLGAPLVLENVRGAQPFIGKAKARWGPYYLWGDGVPALLPYVPKLRKKESLGGRQKHARAVIPFDLAYHIGKVHYEHSTADQRV